MKKMLIYLSVYLNLMIGMYAVRKNWDPDIFIFIEAGPNIEVFFDLDSDRNWTSKIFSKRTRAGLGHKLISGFGSVSDPHISDNDRDPIMVSCLFQ